MSLQTTIFRVLSKKHGMKISPEASKYLIDIFTEAQLDGQGLSESLDYLAQQYVSTFGTISINYLSFHQSLFTSDL
jgi:hypothetical protein